MGGGHYRAYAMNHLNNKWYHFDDSWVTEADVEKSVVRIFSRGPLSIRSFGYFRTPTLISCSIVGQEANWVALVTRKRKKQ